MKILVVTNIPTPYRIAFFNVLNNKLKEGSGALKVLYCAKNEPDRHWEIDLKEQNFEYSILNGQHLNAKGLYLHFNYGVLKETKSFDPNYILYAGSWNMPTVMLSVLFNTYFNNTYKKIFWSEGHDGSILHKKGFVPKIRKYIQNKFDVFAVPNSRSEKYLFESLNLDVKPIVILPNTVDGAFFSKPENWSIGDSNKIKEHFNIPIHSKLIIQVSQIEDRKGIVELVSFWNKLSDIQKDNYHLVVVGEGSLKEKMIQKGKEESVQSIHFLGNQKKEQVRDLLFSSDIFLLLTKNDPNPLTLIEASFAKLPIITTKFAGNCNEIVTKNNGVVVNEITFEEFEKAFILVKNLSEMGNGVHSFENATRFFDIELVAENFVDQLNKI
ncbi:glycosyltransferase family 4 protein [Flavobacterium sp.]|jgi:glycosyltransferase involved in cell wall biosynthesis|uniref:glycosyltransferase family 4 protein n=1 Tax=Flavobacterium sp. TaxID=239 RepID=UPI002A801FBE|nr:glycosyltransferase family 4 protein [Flavobacterium sp.]